MDASAKESLPKQPLTAFHPESAGRPLPGSFRNMGRHALSQPYGHDDYAWLDFIMMCHFHMQQRVFPGNEKAWEARGKAEFQRKFGRAPKDRREVRSVMERDPYWQMWSALKRNTQEMSYDVRNAANDRAAPVIAEKAAKIARGKTKGSLTLNPKLAVPRYITAVDIHLQPGGYNTDDGQGVYAGLSYDSGSGLMTGGGHGKFNDNAGWSLVSFIRSHYPDLKPKVIVDLGCTVGHNTLPLKAGFPQATVHGVDACAPPLRYAHGRAEALGVPIRYSQQDAEKTNFADNSVDVVTTAMFLHEIPRPAMARIAKEIHRILRPGGVMVHAEQPPYEGQPPYEQFIREWDTYYNAEPFRCPFRDMDPVAWATNAGFKRDKVFAGMSPAANMTDQGLKLEGGAWFMIAARK